MSLGEDNLTLIIQAMDRSKMAANVALLAEKFETHDAQIKNLLTTQSTTDAAMGNLSREMANLKAELI